MADLYEVNDGDIVEAADVNQFKTALEGGSSQQYALVQKAGANLIMKLATTNGTDRVSIQNSAGTEVAAIDSLGRITGNTDYLTQAQLIVKDQDESRTNDTTLQNDDSFIIAVEANSTYLVRATLLIDGSTSFDIKTNWHLPANGTSYQRYVTNNSAADADLIINLSGASGTYMYLYDAAIITGATAGTATFQWAQNTSGATATTIKEHSTMEIRKVA